MSVDLRLERAAAAMSTASEHRLAGVIAPIVLGLLVASNESQRDGMKYDPRCSWILGGMGVACALTLNLSAAGHDRRAVRALRGHQY